MIDPILMAHHPSLNDFTWKKTIFVTAQYKVVNTKDFNCRKHVNNKYSWFFFFDDEPKLDAAISSLEVLKMLAVAATDDE